MSRDGLAASKCRPSQPHCPSRPHHPSWLPCPMAAPWPPSCLRAAEPSAATRGCRGAGISVCFCRTGAAWQVALPLEPRGRLARAAGRGASAPCRRACTQRHRAAPPPPPPPPGGGPLARLKREQAGMVPPSRPLPAARADAPASCVGGGSAVRLGGWRGRPGGGRPQRHPAAPWPATATSRLVHGPSESSGGAAAAAAAELAVEWAARPRHDAAARGRAGGRDTPAGRLAPSGRRHAHAHAPARQIRRSLRPPRPAHGVCARAAAARLVHRRAAWLRRVRLRDRAGAERRRRPRSRRHVRRAQNSRPKFNPSVVRVYHPPAAGQRSSVFVCENSQHGPCLGVTRFSPHALPLAGSSSPPALAGSSSGGGPPPFFFYFQQAIFRGSRFSTLWAVFERLVDVHT